MKKSDHCDVCQLCIKPEQEPGSKACKSKMINRFNNGYWHNGKDWFVLAKGRVLTKATILHTKKGRKAGMENKGTLTFVVTDYTQEHEEVLHEWSRDISGFREEGHLEIFVFYMTTNPFSQILEYRIDGYLIGFSWLIIIDNAVIQQLFPWRKKRFSKLSLGAFENEMLVDLWPDKIHFLGGDTEFKSKFGGWVYEGKVLQSENIQVMAHNVETNN